MWFLQLDPSMVLNYYPALLFLASLVLLLGTLELGYRIGTRVDPNDEKRHETYTSTRDHVALLLSLLLGFSMAMALTRFDHRTELVVEEADALGTTMLRAELLPEPARTNARPLLHDYVAVRIEASKQGDTASSSERVKVLEGELWRVATDASERSPTPITALFVASLNESFDMRDHRIAASENRIPRSIWGMLGLLSLLTAFMYGLSQRKKAIVPRIVPPVVLAVVLALVSDLDTQARGFIHLDERSMERLLER